MRSIRSLARYLAAALIAAVMVGLALPARTAAAEETTEAAAAGSLLFAFSGQVTGGAGSGTRLAGDLSLTPGPGGSLSGTLSAPNGDKIADVTGTLAGTNISVTFNLGGDTRIFGIGRANSKGEFTGPFVGPGAGSRGTWFALPATRAVYDFSGTVTDGPSEGTTLAGPLSLTIANNNRFTGNLTVGGSKIPVSGRLIAEHGRIQLRITFDLGTSKIEGRGTSTDGAATFEGPFSGPGKGDRGEWTATAR